MRINVRKFLQNILTVGPIGYLPGSGTLGTLIAIPFVILLNFLTKSLIFQLLVILGLVSSAFLILKFALPDFKFNIKFEDPSEVIIDEFVATFIVFFGISKLNFIILLNGFILFRFLDITKILFLSSIEKRFKGPFGILIDDIAAALITNIILRLYIFYS